MFTYSQMRAFKSAGEHWREHAEYWLEHLPAPVVAIRERVKDNGHCEPAWLRRWEMVRALCHNIQTDSEAPPFIRLAARLVGVWDYPTCECRR